MTKIPGRICAQPLPDPAVGPNRSDPRTCSVDTLTDDELFAAIARNDRSALGALYDRHAAIVFTVAQHVIGARQPAEDLLHDIFLDLARAARACTQVGPILRWLVMQVFERTR